MPKPVANGHRHVDPSRSNTLSATIHILAQQRGVDYGDLVWLLIILVFPALNALGKWIRTKWGNQQEETTGEDTVYEVTVSDDDQLILKPATEKPSPAQSPPTARPLRPLKREPTTVQPVPRALRPVERPQRPVPPRRVQPVRREPAPPRAQPAQPVRGHRPPSVHAARPVQAKPARARKADPHRVFAATSAFDADDQQRPPTTAVDKLLAGETFDAKSLRRAIVLSEILAPPLAMRRNDPSPFSRPD